MARIPRLPRKVRSPRGVIVGVDVETACPSPGAICSIGIAVVSGGAVVQSRQWYTDPRTRFDPRFIDIHGITERDVRGKPCIRDAWTEIHRFINDSIEALKPPTLFEEVRVGVRGSEPDALFVAHNAPFDRRQIEHALDGPLPFTLACTVAMSRRAFPRLARYNLRAVSDHLRIELDHHDALSDARACALIAHHCLQARQGS